MKKLSLIMLLNLLMVGLMAQKIDKDKMEKDVEVAQTVLNSLINENRKVYWNQDQDNQPQFIEGYGVILSLNSRKEAFGFTFPPAPPMPNISNAIATGYEVIEELQFGITEEELSDEERAELEAERAERRKELALRQAELEERAAIAMERAKSKLEQMDSLREGEIEKQIDVIKDFLLDYGHLISQLKDSDKILVMEKGHDAVYLRNESDRLDKLKMNRLSVEAKMEDIRAFQQGKIKREEAENRIVVNKKKEVKPLSKDLALLQTIIRRLYAKDLSDTYYLNSRMPFEQIEGLGVIFYMDMVSSIQSGNQAWTIPTQNMENVTQEERDKLIKSLYPKFEEDLKNNILEYGKNVTSLEKGEQLIFKVNITKCEGCGIPENIEIQVKSETLKKLKSGELTNKQALNQIKVVNGELQ